jgi:hypothetical protein
MTLSTFLTYCKRDFKRTDKNTELTRAYNDMIVWVSALMPHGNYKYQSYITLVDAQEDYPLPTNLVHLIHPVKFLEGTGTNDSGYPLEQLTKEEYDIRYPNPNRTSPTDKGKPTVYCVYSRSILLGPLPDASTYLLEINWAKTPTAQSADSDTPDLGTEWEEVLKQGTLERAYAGVGMLEEANYWASLYRDADHNPVGLCRHLMNAEKSRESKAVGKIVYNDL